MFGRAESDLILNANCQATSIGTGFLKAGIQQRKDQLKFWHPAHCCESSIYGWISPLNMCYFLDLQILNTYNARTTIHLMVWLCVCLSVWIHVFERDVCVFLCVWENLRMNVCVFVRKYMRLIFVDKIFWLPPQKERLSDSCTKCSQIKNAFFFFQLWLTLLLLYT